MTVESEMEGLKDGGKVNPKIVVVERPRSFRIKFLNYCSIIS